MSDLTRWVKKMFGVYEPGYEYWVYFRDIKLPHYLQYSRIGEKKYKHKWDYYRKTGEFESKIILDKDFNLVDGYSSYVIARISKLEKVPVYFADKNTHGKCK